MSMEQSVVKLKLWRAVLEGKEDVVRQLLEDPNYRSEYKDRFGIEWNNTTLLMVASDKGYKSIVQLLHNSGASVNETNQRGRTALHYAARSDHHEIVLDLIKMQASVDAVDEFGRTSLHWAANNGHSRTVQHLLEWKADPDVQDGFGDTPLHYAARLRDGGVVQVLLKNNANPDIKNKDGLYPHEKAMGDLRQQMLQYQEDYRLAKLLRLGGVVSLKIVKAYVVGSSRAGKTTFALAVTNLGDAANVSERTPGIDILEVTLEKVGQLKVHDVAGHDLYHTTHTFFFGGVSALFIYLVDTDLSKEDMLADAIYWLALIISGRLPGHPPAYILLLGSRGGDQDQKARQVKLNSVARQLMKKFKGRFIFILEGKSLVLDMRLADSKEMEEVKKQLAIGAQKCLERIIDVPVVCYKVQRNVLSPLRDEMPSEQFVEKAEFHALVLNEFDAFKDPSLYSSLMYYLEEWGEIVDVGSRLIINTLWLCRSLLAAVLASRADPQSAEFQIRMKAEADGTATFEDIAVVLEDFRELYGTPAVDPEAGIDILCHMGLALPTERKDVYRFPALIQESRPETVWMKTQSVLPAEQHGMVYVGIRLQCQSDIEIFTPAVMPLLQGQVAKLKSEMAVIMWKGGMVVQRICEPYQPKVEALVLISDKRRAIRALDLISRGPAHCQGDVKQFLNKLQQITNRILDKNSPGTRVDMQYLSHQQITQHIDQPFSYTQEEVDLAENNRGILTKVTDTGIVTETTIDLLAVDEDHIIYKLKSLSRHCRDHWLDVGRALLSDCQVIDITAALGTGAMTVDKFCHVVETWIRRRWRTATLDTFMKVCDTVDKRIRQQVIRELGVTGRDPLSSAGIQESINQGETGTTTEQLQAVADVAQRENNGATSVVTESDLDVVAKVARDKWLDVGRALGFKMEELEDYREKEPRSLHHRLLYLLGDWKRKEENPSIETLVRACTEAGIGGDVKRELGLISHKQTS